MRDVAIVAAGVKAPGGTTCDQLWETVRAGRSTARPYVSELLPADAALLVSEVDGFDASAYLGPMERRRLDRAVHLAVGAAQDAVDALDGARPPAERCAIVCGVGFGAAATWEYQYRRFIEGGLAAMNPLGVAMVMPSSAAACLSLRLGFTGPAVAVSAACASGAMAIGEGMELLRRGAADLVLAGGLDALISPAALGGFLSFDVMSRLIDDPCHASRPFDVDRDGFVMGEGAGFVVLQRTADAVSAGRPVLARLVGYASGSDAFHPVAPHPDGDGALRCMQAALADARVGVDEVAQISAHATGTVAGDLAEARAIRRLLGERRVPVTAVKGTTGHLVGGSGAVEAILAAVGLRDGVVPPVAGLCRIDPEAGLDVVVGTPRPVGDGYALSTSFGFGGANVALVLAPAS